jgi:hypothetical protein
MSSFIDPYLVTQIGLDSASLTMLGGIAHGFREPGEYRGVVRRGSEPGTVFYVVADKESGVASVNIDLAALTGTGSQTGCCGGCQDANRFVVNPRGHVLFHVSGGEGGYGVQVAMAKVEADLKIYDTRQLQDGDVFACMFLRPGTYSVSNLLSKSKGEIVVSYPARAGDGPYRPAGPVTVECTVGSIEPRKIELTPAQGVNFQIKTPSRIKIELEKPDDGPASAKKTATRGWKKTAIIKEN